MCRSCVVRVIVITTVAKVVMSSHPESICDSEEEGGLSVRRWQ